MLLLPTLTVLVAPEVATSLLIVLDWLMLCSIGGAALALNMQAQAALPLRYLSSVRPGCQFQHVWAAKEREALATFPRHLPQSWCLSSRQRRWNQWPAVREQAAVRRWL